MTPKPNDPHRDPLWEELEAIERRRPEDVTAPAAWATFQAQGRLCPRFDPDYFKRCPLCLEGPTEIFNLGPVTWSTCAPCEQRWPAGQNLVHPLLWVDDDELYQENFNTLATEFTQIGASQ